MKGDYLEKLPLVLIGYSGHGRACAEISMQLNYRILGYLDLVEKNYDPFGLEFLGAETQDENIQLIINGTNFFVSIGDNQERQKITIAVFKSTGRYPIHLIHPTAHIASTTSIKFGGILVGANVTVNSGSVLGEGVICNSASVVEHDCIIDSFVHIAPGAVLLGNVKVGTRTLVGANAVVNPGITIGKDVMIGSGTVVLKDVPDGCIVVGNPGRIIKQRR